MASKLSLFIKGVRELAKEGDEWATGVLRQIGAAGSRTVKTQGTAREVGRGTPGTIIKKDPKAPGGSRMARGERTALKNKLKNEQRALTRSGALKVSGTAAAGAAVPVVNRKIKENRKAAAEKEKKAKAEATAKRRGASTAAARAAAREGARKTGKTEPTKRRRLILGKDAKIRPFGGVIARALFGKDEDFGNEKGLADFVRRPKKKNMGGEIKKYRGGGFAKQGANARMDESLGERRGKESTKSQSMKSRRNESRGATKPSRPQSAGAAKRGWGAAIR